MAGKGCADQFLVGKKQKEILPVQRSRWHMRSRCAVSMFMYTTAPTTWSQGLRSLESGSDPQAAGPSSRVAAAAVNFFPPFDLDLEF